MSNWFAAETQPSPYELSACYTLKGFLQLGLSVKRNCKTYLITWLLLSLAVASDVLNY